MVFSPCCVATRCRLLVRLADVPLVAGNATICNQSVAATHLVGDSASSAEFFVGVAIVCFLYSMLALLAYLGYMHVYKDSDFGPIFVSTCTSPAALASNPQLSSPLTQTGFQDFAITAGLVFLWLVCSSAWAKGLQNVKDATGSEGISSTLALCTGSNVTCEVTEFANLRTLNISVVRRGTQTGLMGGFGRVFFAKLAAFLLF